MTTYAVTGATGGLGNHAVRGLLRDGVPAGNIVALVRNADKAADLAALGVQVRVADYSQAQTLPAALAGVDRLLLVSSSEVGARVAQHAAVIDAATAAGVSLLVYTSAPRADTTALPLAPEHKATEELIRASGLPFTILRNNWYFENYTSQVAQYVERGAIVDATGSGRVAGAARADYADAAVAVLIGSGHENAIYELGGPAFSMDDLAAAVSEASAVAVTHTSVSPDELVGILSGAGLDAGTAAFVAALDQSIANGDLDSDSTDLERLIGRPTTRLIDAIRAAL
jgi:NAD(P)H dehydrogenase (quinone)